MTNEHLWNQSSRLSEPGEAERAAAAIVQCSHQACEEPRAVLRVLDALDKQKKDADLHSLIAKLENHNILHQELLVYKLRVWFRAADYRNALRVIDDILGLSERHNEALRTAGRIGNLLHDDDLAVRYWERLALSAPDDTEAALQAARIRLRREQYREAFDWAQRAAELRPQAAEPLQIAVRAGLEIGWPQAGDALLLRLFAIDRPPALRAFSRVRALCDSERVAQLLSRLRRDFPCDAALAELAGKTYPEWLVAGLEHELACRDLEAAAFYRAARLLRPGDPDGQRGLDRLNRPSLTAMRDAFNGRNFEGAIEHGGMAARIDPACVEVWQTVGRAHFHRGNVAEARNAFRRCTELQAADGRTWLTYGIILNQTSDRPGALAAFRKARDFGGSASAEVTREAESSIEALYPLLVADASQAAADGNVELGWQCCDAAAAIHAEDSGIDRLRRDLLRELRERIRQLWNTKSPSVVLLCRQYDEKAPNDPYVLTVLGRTLMGLRAYREALPVWQQLASLNPGESHPPASGDALLPLAQAAAGGPRGRACRVAP